jgi:hypothetical protein
MATKTASEVKSNAPLPRKSSIPKPRPHSDVLADLGVVPVWESYPELVDMGFGALVEKRTQLKDEMEFRKKKIEEIDLEIQAYMTIAGAEKVTWEDRPVQVVHSRSGSKIVAEKLLMAGVAAQTIADATEEGKPYQYVLVGRVSSKK